MAKGRGPMRRLLWCVPLLLPAVAGAQDFIRYYPPQLVGSTTAPANQSLVFGSGQSLTLCNTADCATDYERATLSWVSNQIVLNTSKGGAGTTVRDIRIGDANQNLWFGGNGGSTGIAYAAGMWLPAATDVTDQGSSTNLWRTGYFSRGWQGSKSKSLTDGAAAVSIERVAVPTNGYMGTLTAFTANSTDGTDRLTTSGLVSWAGADTGGTVTCGSPVVVALSTAYRRANTLVCTFTAATSTTNCDLQVTCTDNLAGSQTMAIEHFPIMPRPNTYASQ